MGEHESVAYGAGVSLKVTEPSFSAYLASAGLADPSVGLRVHREGLAKTVPALHFEPSVFRFDPVGHRTNKGNNVEYVEYGSAICVTHVSSNLVLTVVRKPAPHDSTCLTLKLMTKSDAGSACHFRITPRYKVRADGHYMRDGDIVMLQQFTSSYSLHVSVLPDDDGGLTGEVNTAEEPTCVQIHLYDLQHTASESRRQVQRAGKAAFIFHSESDALLTLPSTKQIAGLKDRRHTNFCTRDEVIFRKVGTSLAAIDVDHVDLSCNSMWVFEHVDPRHGGPLTSHGIVRVRHAVTGKYLYVVEFGDNQYLSLIRPTHDDHYNRTLFELSLLEGLHHEHISAKSFTRLKHVATGTYIGAVKATASTSVVQLLSEPTLDDTLTIISVPPERQQTLGFLTGNMKCLLEYVKYFGKHLENLGSASPRVQKQPWLTNDLCKEIISRTVSSLEALIVFCTEGPEEDPLQREGLPYPTRQQSMFDISLDRIAVDVILAPFAPRGVGMHLRMSQMFSNEGVFPFKEITQPENVQLHYVCRLCLRLLKQMSKKSPVLSEPMLEYVPFMQQLEGFKLHVADTLMEVYSDNPTMPLHERSEEDIRHFVDLLVKNNRSAGYVKFLSKLCAINGTGVRRNQKLVCQLVLRDNPQILMVTGLQAGVVCVQVQGKEKLKTEWVPLSEFLRNGAAKQVKFFSACIDMLGTLCVGSDSDVCTHVERTLPWDQLYRLLDHNFPCSNELRASFLLIAQHLYCRRCLITIAQDDHPLRRTCGSLVSCASFSHELDGTQGSSTPSVSGLNVNSRISDVVLQKVKASCMHFFKRYSSQTDEPGLNQLLGTCASTWFMIVKYRRYKKKESSDVMPLLMAILDGNTDTVSSRYVKTEASTTVMGVKAVVCDVIDALLRNEVDETVDRTLEFVERLRGQGNNEKSPGDVFRDQMSYMKTNLIHFDELMNILVDLLKYESTTLVSKALHLIFMICNLEAYVAQRLSHGKLMSTVRDNKIFELISSAMTDLQHNGAIGGGFRDDDALTKTVVTLVESNFVDDVKRTVSSMSPRNGVEPSCSADSFASTGSTNSVTRDSPSPRGGISAASGKRWAKIAATVKMKGAFRDVQTKRRRWKVDDRNTIHFSECLERSGMHNELVVPLANVAIGSQLHFALIEFFRVFCASDAGAEAMTNHFSLFEESLANDSSAPDAAFIMLRILSRDSTLALDLDPALIHRFIHLLDSEKDSGIASGMKLLVLNGFPLLRNQRLVLDALISKGLVGHVRQLCGSWSATQLTYHACITDLIAWCCVGNGEARDKLRRHLTGDDILTFVVTSSTEHKDVHMNHYIPLLRLVHSAYLICDDDVTVVEQQERRRLWTESTVWWDFIWKFVVVTINDALSTHMKEFIDLYFVGLFPVLSKYFTSLFVCDMTAFTPPTSMGQLLLGMIKFCNQSSECPDVTVEHYKSLHEAMTSMSEVATRILSEDDYQLFAEMADSVEGLARGADVPQPADMESVQSSFAQQMYPMLMELRRDLSDNYEPLSKESLQPFITRLCGNEATIAAGAKQNPQLKQLHDKLVRHISLKDLDNTAVSTTLKCFRFILESIASDHAVLAENQKYLDGTRALQIVTELASEPNDEVLRESLRLGIAILENGNLDVQNRVLDYFTNHDERFFLVVEDVMHRATAQAALLKTSELSGTVFSKEQVHTAGNNTYRFLGDIFRFLQLLCEGHHRRLQNYIRDQFDNLRSVNVVRALGAFINEAFSCDKYDQRNEEVLLRSLALMCEMCQGPNMENQLLLVNANAFHLLSLLLVGEAFVMTPPLNSDASESLLRIKSSAMTTYLALLEGSTEEHISLAALSQLSVDGIISLLTILTDGNCIADGLCDEAHELVYNTIILLKCLVSECPPCRERQQATNALKRFAPVAGMLGHIEIERNSRLEQVYFRVPEICVALTHEQREHLLWSVDRSTQGSKLTDFLDKADEVIYEMEIGASVMGALEKKPLIGDLMKIPKPTWNDASLVIAVVMNIMFVAFYDNGTYASGTGAMIWMLAVSQTLVTLLLCIYEASFNIPLVLYKTRKGLENPTTAHYATAVASRPQTIICFLLLLASVAGLLFSEFFFALFLFKCIAKSSILLNVIVAITQNGKSLLLTGGLGVIVSYTFAIIGYAFYRDQFESESACDTLFRCTVHIVTTGLRQGGGIGDAMSGTKWSDNHYTGRLFYDFAFYALMIVIFLNILFGIIIDTFAELRDEKTKKEEDMRTKCFICGIDAYTFDRYGSGYAYHVKWEHNVWQYLYFIHHLRRKPVSEYNGQESYVSMLISKGDISFFPSGKSAMLSRGRADNSSDDEQEVISSPPGTVQPVGMTRTHHDDALRAVLMKMDILEKRVETVLKEQSKPVSSFRSRKDSAYNQPWAALPSPHPRSLSRLHSSVNLPLTPTSPDEFATLSPRRGSGTKMASGKRPPRLNVNDVPASELSTRLSEPSLPSFSPQHSPANRRVNMSGFEDIPHAESVLAASLSVRQPGLGVGRCNSDPMSRRGTQQYLNTDACPQSMFCASPQAPGIEVKDARRHSANLMDVAALTHDWAEEVMIAYEAKATLLHDSRVVLSPSRCQKSASPPPRREIPAAFARRDRRRNNYLDQLEAVAAEGEHALNVLKDVQQRRQSVT